MIEIIGMVEGVEIVKDLILVVVCEGVNRVKE